MVRVAGLSFGIGIAFAAIPLLAGEPPVVAPKPASRAANAGCPSCRFLPGVPRSERLLTSQFGPELATPEPATPERTTPEGTPQPLPLPDEVAPLPAAPPSAALQELVRHYLPNVSAEEQRIWAEELRLLPTEVARDLLAARSAFSEPRTLPTTPDTSLVPPLQSEPTPNLQRPVDAGPVPRWRSDSHDIGDRPSSNESLAILQRVEAILLHNVANALTPGYKRLRPLTAEAARGEGLGGFSAERCEIQGELEESGRHFDLAIDGAGMFQVRRGDAVALTRRGNFRLTAGGTLALPVDGEDWLLHPEISIPPEWMSLTIRDDGLVACVLPGGAEIGLGQIELVRVADLSRLESIGGGLFSVPESVGAITIGLPVDEGFGMIRQGCLEQSNVDLPAEIAALTRLRQQMATLRGLPPAQWATPGNAGSVH